jgi:hypothetical protein
LSTASGDRDPAPPEQRTVDNPQDAEPDEFDPDIFPTQIRTAADAAAAAALAQAERAVARHAGTPEEVEGVAEAGKARRAEDRLAGWRRDHSR